MLGEEAFHLHVATPIYVKLIRVFFPCWYATGSSFPAGVQPGFFSCWYARGFSYPAGASLPAGDSQGLLSLLVLHKFPTLKFYHGNQTKQAISEMRIFKNKMTAVVAIFEFQSAQS